MKISSTFVCQQCGYQSASFLGKCPECGEWNSLVETKVSTEGLRIKDKGLSVGVEQSLVKLSDVKNQQIRRFSAGFEEFDRVLGGGIVPGSIVLISGDPGIGKSTLLLQSAMRIAKSTTSGQGTTSTTGMRKNQKARDTRDTLNSRDTPVLYVTGEESAQQVKIRADRIVHSSQFTLRLRSGQTVHSLRKTKKEKSVNHEPSTENLFILPATDVEAIVAASEKLAPTLLIVDSIQTLTSSDLSGAAGSVGQVRECAQILQRHAKTSGTPIFLVGHVTKEGSIAGPKVLEHLVDAVLNLEGDGTHAFRLLRSVKNRFGSTFEVGVFEMRDSGMVEVSNPSQIFLAQRISSRPGSVVTSTIAGGRPILAEVQALCTSTIFPVPTRRVTGLDFARTQIVIAALAKVANLALGNLDIYVNVAGGLKIFEPASDLPVALAIASAVVNKPVSDQICAFGEVGLLGELRQVVNLEGRIKEAKRLGFDDFVTPGKFKTLEDAIGYAVHGG